MSIMYKAAFGDQYFPQYYESDNFNSSLSLYTVVIFIYFIIVGGMLFYSLQYSHNHPQAYATFYSISTILGIYMWISFIMIAYTTIKSLYTDRDTDSSMYNQEESDTLQYMIYGTILF